MRALALAWALTALAPVSDTSFPGPERLRVAVLDAGAVGDAVALALCRDARLAVLDRALVAVAARGVGY